MRFAQFWQRSAVDRAEVIEGTGDRSVIILDDRERVAGNHDYCERMARARGYVGYSIHRGESFTRSHVLHSLTLIHYRYTLHRADGTRIGEAHTAQGIADRAHNAEFSHDTTEPEFPFVVYRFDPLGLVGDPFRTSLEAIAECMRVAR